MLGGNCLLAQTQYKVLYNFSGPDGNAPSSLMFDDSGNLYGITQSGGQGTASNCPYGCGTVFRLSPNPNGNWTLKTLYEFCTVNACLDGNTPTIALVLDSSGNLYGTTQFGGSMNKGVVFELSPSSGFWKETVLYNFCTVGANCLDGEQPSGAIARDATGNLYGITVTGGSGCAFQVMPGCGTAFELTPPAVPGGVWTETVISDFCAIAQGTQCPGGDLPLGGLILDKSGNLFGAAAYGGIYSSECFQGCGTLFKLSPGPSGWKYTVLYAPPSPSTGEYPVAPLTLGAAGAIYGSFAQGGRIGAGVLFRITSAGKGVEYSLAPGNDDQPDAALVVGNGVVYGSAFGSHSFTDDGSVFSVTSKGENILHTFCSESNCADGSGPLGLTQDKTGNLYGAANQGGTMTCFDVPGCGLVFEIAR